MGFLQLACCACCRYEHYCGLVEAERSLTPLNCGMAFVSMVSPMEAITLRHAFSGKVDHVTGAASVLMADTAFVGTERPNADIVMRSHIAQGERDQIQSNIAIRGINTAFAKFRALVPIGHDGPSVR